MLPRGGGGGGGLYGRTDLTCIGAGTGADVQAVEEIFGEVRACTRVISLWEGLQTSSTTICKHSEG